jgi:hypothetical protein
MQHSKFLAKIFMLAFLGGLVFLFFRSSSEEKTRFLSLLHLPDQGVKGAATTRADTISNQIKSDVSSSAASLKDQVLNVKVSDALGEFNRIQKIPRDIHSLQNFAQTQVSHFLKEKFNM